MEKHILAPKLGMTMEFVEVLRWRKSNNDYVEKGEPLLELLNDKAVVEFESPDSGYLQIVAEEGGRLNIGEVLGILRDKRNG